MAEFPEIADRNETDEQTAACLAELETLLQETEKLRFRQQVIFGSTILLMLIALTVFILGMIDYFRSYPKEQLMREVIKQERLFLGNPYHFGINGNNDRRLVRYFLTEMKRELKNRRPVIRQSVRSGVRSLHDFSETELRRFFQNRLYVRLTAKAEQYAQDRKYPLDPRKTVLLRQLNAALAAEVTARLFDQSLRSRQENYRLFQQETDILRQSSIYRELEQEPMEMVEERMLENLLECIVCRLNETKAFDRKENRK